MPLAPTHMGHSRRATVPQTDLRCDRLIRSRRLLEDGRALAKNVALNIAARAQCSRLLVANPAAAHSVALWAHVVASNQRQRLGVTEVEDFGDVVQPRVVAALATRIDDLDRVCKRLCAILVGGPRPELACLLYTSPSPRD